MIFDLFIYTFPPLVAIAAVQTILGVPSYDLLVERFPRSSPLDGLRQSSLCDVRRIFWVTRPDKFAPSVRAAFLATCRLRSEVDAELFMTELGNESGTRELPLGENPIRLSFNRVP